MNLDSKYNFHSFVLILEKDVRQTFPQLDEKVSLLFTFKAKGMEEGAPYLFQVDFFKNYGLYRVELRESGKGQKFAYFKNNQVYQKILGQFNL